MPLLPSRWVTETMASLFHSSLTRVVDQALLHGLVGVAFISLLAKLHAWDESALFFDGSSIGKSLLVSFPSILIHCHP
jgi:hypothetical protein